ncbi:hypothetical protein QYF61_019014 [Mycteria americana]|uniref:Uncharacterized protein n=1 Tax=Mycteria americana TaxID=33587 RepID=A0AAN7NPJ6_MYCAM|nr:hypothetical protein QYF61_019014 [Mycteria americana]
MTENLISGKTSLKGPKTSAKKQKGEKKAKESSKGKRTQLGKKDEVDLSMVGIGHPEIFPLVFTTKTQEIFNCRVDEDVTEENCFKLIKKEDIIQDLKTRATISDFHPVKKVVLEYPGEELLVVFDPKFQYGQNFYFVASEEAKENLLKPPETAEEKEEKEEENREETLEVHPYKPPVHKPWVSLGSEKEVEEESVKDTVTKVKYMISRVRRKFGAPITFTDTNASHVKGSYVECTSYQDKTFSIKMLEKDVGIEMVPKVREASTQTKWTYPKNAATQYFPRQLSNEEKEESLSSEKLKEFLTSVHSRMEIALQQNEIMNAFFDDWKALAEDESSSGGKPDVYLKAYKSFTDLRYLKDRTISCVCWHPTIYGNAAKQPQFPQPLLIRLLLQTLHQLRCPSLDTLQHLNVSLVARGPKLNTVFEVVLWDISQHEEKLQNAKPIADGIQITAVNMVNASILNILQYIYMSVRKNGSILFWDIPATKLPEQPSSEKGKEEEIFDMLPDVPDTSKHLDLCWKPLIKINLCESDTNTEYSPIRISLRELHYHYKTSGQLQQRGDSTRKHLTCKTAALPGSLSSPLLLKFPLSINYLYKTKDLLGLINSIVNKEMYPYPFPEKVQSLNTLEVPAKENPYTEMSTPSSKNLKALESISTDFFVGTEDGEIVYSDWKMEIGCDSAKPVSQKHTQKYTIHTETINTLQRSPFFKDIILSVGGRNFAIWKEGVTHANVLNYFEREVKYLKYCEQEFQEHQEFQAKTELKWSWRHRGRKQYVVLGIKKTFFVSLGL